jgi:SAM-dependent methyltransferase
MHAPRCHLVADNRARLDDGLFDVVVSVEVMEHVESLTSYLRDIHRLLSPGGRFVWTTPCANAFSIEHLYGLVTRKIEPTEEGYRRWAWEDPAHLRRLKSREISLLLKETGFSRVTFRYRAHLFSFVCSSALAQRFGRLREPLMTLDYSLFRSWPNGASMIGLAVK